MVTLNGDTRRQVIFFERREKIQSMTHKLEDVIDNYFLPQKIGNFLTRNSYRRKESACIWLQPIALYPEIFVLVVPCIKIFLIVLLKPKLASGLYLDFENLCVMISFPRDDLHLCLLCHTS